MAKIQSGLRIFSIKARYVSESFVADAWDMLKIISDKKIWYYIPEVKELEMWQDKFKRIPKSEIMSIAKHGLSNKKISKSQYETIKMRYGN